MTESMDGDSRRLLDTLRNVELFAALDEHTLELLRGKMRRAVYQPGDVLCTEGEAADRMFIIESGEISVLKQGQDAAPAQITVMLPGEVAGELSLFGEATRNATLQARTEATILVLGHEDFQLLLEQHAELSQALLVSISRHLRRQNSIVAKLLTRDDRRGGLKVAFFDSKPYMADIFKKQNTYGYNLTFYDSRLSRDTVPLTVGYKAVCVFVNDQLDAEVIEELRVMGVELIALRGVQQRRPGSLQTPRDVGCARASLFAVCRSRAHGCTDADTQSKDPPRAQPRARGQLLPRRPGGVRYARQDGRGGRRRQNRPLRAQHPGGLWLHAPGAFQDAQAGVGRRIGRELRRDGRAAGQVGRDHAAHTLDA